jgi:hypothetical protein
MSMYTLITRPYLQKKKEQRKNQIMDCDAETFVQLLAHLLRHQ